MDSDSSDVSGSTLDRKHAARSLKQKPIKATTSTLEHRAARKTRRKSAHKLIEIRLLDTKAKRSLPRQVANSQTATPLTKDAGPRYTAIKPFKKHPDTLHEPICIRIWKIIVVYTAIGLIWYLGTTAFGGHTYQLPILQALRYPQTPRGAYPPTDSIVEKPLSAVQTYINSLPLGALGSSLQTAKILSRKLKNNPTQQCQETAKAMEHDCSWLENFISSLEHGESLLSGLSDHIKNVQCTKLDSFWPTFNAVLSKMLEEEWLLERAIVSTEEEREQLVKLADSIPNQVPQTLGDACKQTLLDTTIFQTDLMKALLPEMQRRTNSLPALKNVQNALVHSCSTSEAKRHYQATLETFKGLPKP